MFHFVSGLKLLNKFLIGFGLRRCLLRLYVSVLLHKWEWLSLIICISPPLWSLSVIYFIIGGYKRFQMITAYICISITTFCLDQEWTADLLLTVSSTFIENSSNYSVSALSVFWREGVCAARINMKCEKSNKCNRDLQVSWAIYSREWIFWSLAMNKLHTSHSWAWCDTFQFLPNSLCSHLLAKLSICVCIWVTKKGSLCGWEGCLMVYICVYSLVGRKLCVWGGLCWPAWLTVNHSSWISVSQWSHLLQRSCKLLTVPGWL